MGRYVVVRCRDAGVHAGEYVSHSGREVTLKEARRLWAWRVPMGKPYFLSGLAQFGIDHAHSKIGTPISVILTEACEIIDVSPEAERLIRSAPECNRTQ